MEAILQVTVDSYFPSVCGNAFVAADFSSMIGDLGYKSVLLMNNKSDLSNVYVSELDDPKSKTYVFNPFGRQESIDMAVKMIREIFDIKCVIFHALNTPRSQAVYQIFKGEVPVMSLNHYEQSIDEVRKELSQVDKVIMFQKPHVNAVKRALQEKASRVHYIPHPVPDVYYGHDEDFGARTPKTIVYAGRLVKEKGVERLFEFMNLNRDYTFEIFGDSHDRDYVEHLMMQTGPMPNVFFTRGFVDRKTLAGIFKTREIFFLGSCSECYSLVASEALVSGMKVVALEQEGAYDWASGEVHIFNKDRQLLDLIPQISDNEGRDSSVCFDRDELRRSAALSKFSDVISDCIEAAPPLSHPVEVAESPEPAAKLFESSKSRYEKSLRGGN